MTGTELRYEAYRAKVILAQCAVLLRCKIPEVYDKVRQLLEDTEAKRAELEKLNERMKG